jgi:cobalt-precorrin-5B (C1)-methyltransferase
LALRSKALRTGYTTGACAAAAAKAATLALLGADVPGGSVIEIPFPDGTRHGLKASWINCGGFPQGIFASVIKDGGDDPDVTNGAEIIAKVVFAFREETKWQNGKMAKWASDNSSISSISRLSGTPPSITIKGGKGVGRVTRPGLPVPIGEPAINPGPRQMIRDAVSEALQMMEDNTRKSLDEVEVTIWVPEGESIARKTLNSRLGIMGGISILGTTGIVRPISAEAWTATIATSMNVARAMGRKEIVLSSGRSSEKAHAVIYPFPEEAYVMMGDYVEFALLESKKHAFERVHLAAQWAKMLKIAMTIPQTHVRHGAIDLKKTAIFLSNLGYPNFSHRELNTAREMFDMIMSSETETCRPILARVCSAAAAYAQSVTGNIPVSVHLVSYNGEIIAQNG